MCLGWTIILPRCYVLVTTRCQQLAKLLNQTGTDCYDLDNIGLQCSLQKQSWTLMLTTYSRSWSWQFEVSHPPLFAWTVRSSLLHSQQIWQCFEPITMLAANAFETPCPCLPAKVRRPVSKPKSTPPPSYAAAFSHTSIEDPRLDTLLLTHPCFKLPLYSRYDGIRKTPMVPSWHCLWLSRMRWNGWMRNKGRNYQSFS